MSNNKYNIEQSSVYPNKGFVAFPGTEPWVSKALPKDRVNGRIKTFGFVARPKQQQVAADDLLRKRKRLNGRTRNCGFVATP
jgi:hypothetical protein